KTAPMKVTVVPALPPESASRNGPAGCVWPIAPYTVELLLKMMLPWLLAAVDTAMRPATGGLLSVKISIAGPPGTPTLSVPVVAEPDMSTPLSTPFASRGIVPGPTAVCLCEKAGEHQALIAANDNNETRSAFTETDFMENIP